MRISPQALKGIIYTTADEGIKHRITLKSTVSNITTHYEGGICVFLGTTHSAAMTGAAKVEATNLFGEAVNLTAT